MGSATPDGTSRFRFGAFEVDLRAGELLRKGYRVRLQDKPFRILEMLVRQAGQVVTREELREKLWPRDTFVDFDHSIGTAINKLRQALGESAQRARYVETLPGRGYRFIAAVEAVDVSVGGAPDTAAPREAPGSRRNLPRLRASFVALAAITVLLGVIAGTLILRTPGEPRVLRTEQLTSFGRVESGGGEVLLTDGARLYFVERDGGRVSPAQVSMAGGDPQPLATPFPNAALMDIAPERGELLLSSFVALSEERPLWVMPILGGAPRRLGEFTISDVAVWSPDRTRLLYSRDSDLYLSNDEGGAPRKLVTTAGWPIRPRWSPDGRLVRFTVENSVGQRSLWEIGADGKNLRRLLADWKSGAPEDISDGNWVAGGRYFVFKSHARESSEGPVSRLWAIREKGFFGPRAAKTPSLLYTSPMELQAPVASSDGKRLFVIGRQERRELARFDQQRNQFVPYLGGIPALWPSFSRDGQWVAYVSFPGRQLWRSRPNGEDRLQLSFPPIEAFYPQWSPDGTRIAFVGHPAGKLGRLYVVVPSAGGAPEPIVSEEYAQDNPNWSPDGASVLFRGCRLEPSQTSCLPRLFKVDLRTNRLSVIPGSEGMGDPNWSPDGRYVVAHSADARSLQVFDFKTGQWKELARGALFTRAYWSGDSRFVYLQDFYAGTSQPILRARVPDGPVDTLTATRQLLPADVTAFNLAGLAPDGSPLASLIRTNSDLYALDVDFP